MIYYLSCKEQPFVVLDLNQAYLQLELDEESVKLLVLNTPRGLYRNKRLPFGLLYSSFIVQRFMDTTFIDLTYVQAFLDVVIGDRDLSECYKTLARYFVYSVNAISMLDFKISIFPH